jgi:competence CoiA-like predicted nuclease
MKNDEGLDFALSRTTGRMVDITMVERGLACDCICPSCGATLQARKGRKNRHHFSHYVAGSAAATCEGGRESALHAAARYIIAAWRQIELPALIVRMEACRIRSPVARLMSFTPSCR